MVVGARWAGARFPPATVGVQGLGYALGLGLQDLSPRVVLKVGDP